MGNACSDSATGGELDGNPSVISGKDELTKSGVLLSHDLDKIITQERENLFITGYPTDRGSKSWLVLSAGQGLDPQIFTRLYLIYSFYVDKYDPKRPQSKDFDKIFYELSQNSHGATQKQEIEKFRGALQKGGAEPKKNELYLDAYLNHHFISDNINRIMLSTDSPKLIANVTAPLYRIFKGIKQHYDQSSFNNTKPVYIVAVLQPEEEKKLNELLKADRFMSFAIFMRGFTDSKMAQAKLKELKGQCPGKKVVKFIVSFPGKKVMKKDSDNGYFITQSKTEQIQKDGNVLFNIMNTFRVTSKEGNEIELEYGYLPRLLLARSEDRQNRDGEEAVKVIQLCEAVSRHFLKSQSFLFRLIGHSKDSVRVSTTIISKSSPSTKGLDDIERQNLIYSHMDEENYEEALKVAEEGKGSFLLKTKKLEILFEQKKIEEAKALIEELNKSPDRKKKENETCIYTIELIAARIQMMEDRTKKARDRLRKLQKDMVIKYENNYQVIGRSVISALDQAYRNDKSQGPADEDKIYSSYSNVTSSTIRASKIKLRNSIN